MSFGFPKAACSVVRSLEQFNRALRIDVIMTKVLIIESEKGWGQKVDEVKEFATKEEAEQFCRKYNREHNPPMDQTPEWYMYAKLEGQEGFGMLR